MSNTVKKTDVYGTPADPGRWMYQRDDVDFMFREFTVDSGKGGDPVVIAQLSDPHINIVDDEDMKNPTLVATAQNRQWLANGKTIPSLQKQLAFCESVADQVIITGDLLDYLTHAGLKFLREEIWEKHPGILVTNGNHEYIQVMFNYGDLPTPIVPESIPLEERYQMLRDNWAHDLDYTSLIIEDKVMLIQLDNGMHKFTETQVPQLSADIETARERGIPVLLFMHIPVYTRNEKEAEVPAMRDDTQTKCDFYRNSRNDCVGKDDMDPDDPTAQVYSLIVNNADVVKGVLNGHMHEGFYSEIVGKNPQTGETVLIPQYTMRGSCYGNGHITLITVR